MASGRRLLALLAALERGLSAPTTSAAQAERLVDTAYNAFDLAQHHACVAEASPDVLIRQVVALARSMVALDAALTSGAGQRGAARRLDLSCKAVVDQISAACMALQTASLILRTLQLQPSTAPQAADGSELAAGLVIVFSAGSASLEACRSALVSAAPASSAARQAGARLGEFANHQVVAANASLAAVQSIAGSSFSSNAAAAQAFPGWLVSLGHTLQLCSRQSGANPRGIRLWAAFASLAVNAAVSMEPAVRGSPASQQVVAEVLLGCCLPALEAECVASRSGGGGFFRGSLERSGEDTTHAALLAFHSDEAAVAQQALLDTLPSLLQQDTGPFHGQLLAHLADTPGAAQAALRAAASIVSALPERPPAGRQAAVDWACAHRQAGQLFCLLDMQTTPMTPAERLGQWREQLRLVPHVLAVMHQLRSSRQLCQPPEIADLAMYVYCLLLTPSRPMATLRQGSNPVFASPADTTCWAAAAEAALRALPLLSSLAQQPEAASTAPQGSAKTFRSCASGMLRGVWLASSGDLHGWAQRLLGRPELRGPAPITAEAAAEAAAELWQLQCTSSCALHYFAAGGRLAALGMADTPQTLAAMLAALVPQFVAGHTCMQLAWGGSRGVLHTVPLASHGVPLAERVSARRMQALCITTWAAIRLVAGTPGGQQALLSFEGLAALIGILSEMGDTVGFEVAGLLHSVVHQLIATYAPRPVAEKLPVLESLYRMLMGLMVHAVRQPWVAASLASSGVLAQFVALGKSEDLMHMLFELDSWATKASGALASLKRLARSALSDLAGSGGQETAGEVAAQLQAALAALDAATSAMEHAEAAFHQAMADKWQDADGSSIPSRMLGMVSSQHIGDDTLRCAADVGAALRRYQQLPAQQTAAQVQLALASAVRGCSNLACANLEGSRARELEEGKPNQLCSACKVARYCCAACQAEDWKRGGHRRVCRLLKPAKAAQAEQQQQPG